MNIKITVFILSGLTTTSITAAEGQFRPIHPPTSALPALIDVYAEYYMSNRKTSPLEFICSAITTKQVDILKPNNYGATPLHMAASCTHLEAIILLLAKDADPATQDMAGYTPLHYCIQGPEFLCEEFDYDSLSSITLFLSHSKEVVHIKSNANESVLDLLLRTLHNRHTAKQTLHSRTRCKTPEISPIIFEFKILETLLDHGAQVDHGAQATDAAKEYFLSNSDDQYRQAIKQILLNHNKQEHAQTKPTPEKHTKKTAYSFLAAAAALPIVSGCAIQ